MASLPPDLTLKSPETAVFAHRGQPLAIVPSAIGQAFTGLATLLALDTSINPEEDAAPLQIVRITGPITHEFDPKTCFDTYDAIAARVTCACDSESKTIVLWINSPGGDVAGAFDCARGIQATARAAGKRLIAFTEGRACSAAYALACAADEIVASDTAEVGSVGTIVDLADASAALAAQGISHRLVVSGARKGDASPVVALSDGAVDAVQRRVDEMAGIFFSWVAQNRPLKAAAVEALQADIFVGAQAVKRGLADRVMSWRELVTSLEAKAAPANDSSATAVVPTGLVSMTGPKGNVMAKAEDKKDDKGEEKREDSMRASLVVAAESDDPEKKARAQRALAAYDADEAGEKDDKKENKDAKASAVAPDASAAAIAGLATTLAERDAEIASLRAAAVAPSLSDAEQRAAVFASRPDLSVGLIASLKAVPTASLASIVAAVPRASFTPSAEVAALSAATAPRGAAAPGATGSDPDLLLDREDLEQLNAAYNVAPHVARGVVNDGPIQRFGVAVPRVN